MILERYADFLPIFRIHRTDQPIFPEDFGVSVMLRIAQFRLISVSKEQERLRDVVSSVFEEVGSIEDDNRRSAAECIAITTVLATMGIANHLDNWLELLLKFSSMLREGEMLRALLLSGKDTFDRDESDVSSELFSIGSSRIETVEQLEYIIDKMDRLTPRDRSMLFSRTEEEYSMCSGFISGPWLSQQRSGDLDAHEASVRYGRMAEKSRGWGFKLLSMNCIATQAVMLDEYVGNKEAAVNVVREAIEVHGQHPVLAHALAKVYWRAKEYESTLMILRDVAKKVGEGNPVDGAYALRIAAISAAKCGDWVQAEQWFINAREFARQAQIDDMAVMGIGLDADAAVAAYHVGDVSRSVAGLASTVEALSGVTEDATLRSGYCHRVVRRTILWLQSQVSEDKVEVEGHPLYMEPGACSNPEPADTIQELPLAHIDISWYLLAEIEIRLGMESSIASAPSR